MRKFDDYMKSYSHLEGWFQLPAIAIWDALLDFQQQQQIVGNILEIGVWKGKSAALAALHCRADEQCVFVDPLPLDGVRECISAVMPSTKCHYLTESSQFLPRHPFLAQGVRSFRWIHIDGEHTAQAVSNDLAIAELLLGDRGMLVMDDFFNPGYPQVTQAVFQFLNAQPGRLTMVLCGFGKAYLCRPRAAREYLSFMSNSLYSEMNDRQCGGVTIWKTTEPADMNTFGVTERYMDYNYRGPDWNDRQIDI